MQVRVAAFSKINLLLDVLGKRTDGYHDVNMIMQGVRLSDQVIVAEAATNTITTNSPYVPNNKSNLALKAALLMQAALDLPPVAIKVDKHIPVSAGMAGGSSDAAAVLLAMDRLFALGLRRQQLEAFAAEIGSDVPFCLSAGTAVATGRGELIQDLSLLSPFHLVLVKADFGVPTARVYKAYRKKKKPVAGEDRLDYFLKLIREDDTLGILNSLYNDLEETTFSMYPKVRSIKEKLKHLGARHVLMSGSGPTVFAAFHTEAEAWQFYKKAKAAFPMVYLTSTVSRWDLDRRIGMS
ncbi:4-(cytidine 5'-diphospho)-2-C-methyl-D-erythritol kinase [Peptococcus simiae]|uniref:4-diphosphocytidyl-2-C-methyl-D-erythritol kinase n=1 Tax=Peptococcus simiae TaxID=1643805 RepID=A0ABW9GXB5_9FIRM